MLKPSCDAKVRARPSQKNTIGTAPGPDHTCPFATIGPGGCWTIEKEGGKCRTCYVDKLQHAYPAVAKVLLHNEEELHQALMSDTPLTSIRNLYRDEFNRFLKLEVKRANAEKRNVGRPAYRLQWSGDLICGEHAQGLSLAMMEFPAITFWMYTRNFDALGLGICYLDNLQLFISLDPCNAEAGIKWLRARYKERKPDDKHLIRISYMGNELPTCVRQFMKDYNQKEFRCPVDAGKMKLEEACQNNCRFCLRDDPRVLVFETK